MYCLSHAFWLRIAHLACMLNLTERKLCFWWMAQPKRDSAAHVLFRGPNQPTRPMHCTGLSVCLFSGIVPNCTLFLFQLSLTKQPEEEEACIVHRRKRIAFLPEWQTKGAIRYRGARLIVPRFWNSKFERIRGIWTIEPLRGLLIEHHSKKG